MVNEHHAHGWQSLVGREAPNHDELIRDVVILATEEFAVGHKIIEAGHGREHVAGVAKPQDIEFFQVGGGDVRVGLHDYKPTLNLPVCVKICE